MNDGSGIQFVNFLAANGPVPPVSDGAISDVSVFRPGSVLNVPPAASNDTSFTNKNTPALISVLLNDTDADGAVDPTTVTIVIAPSHGTTSVDATTGVVTYTPALDYTGPDFFTYREKDNSGADSNVAIASILIQPLPWRNPLLPVDVDDDSSVSPLDVLLLINRLNLDASLRVLPTPSTEFHPALESIGAWWNR